MYTNSNIRFVLERYASGGSNRYTCPQCGKRKCFTRYIDTETGEYVADECGKCDHDSSCQYHYPPREYFRDHPDIIIGGPPCQAFINGSPSILKKTVTYNTPAAEPPVQTEFFDMAWAEKASMRTSTFSNWFVHLPFDEVKLKSVLIEYLVGATDKDVVVDGFNYGPATVFWMIDEQQRVHDAKFIAYQSDGHRVQGWGNSLRSICKKTGLGPQLEWTEKVLFGLHLLPKYSDKVVCIVESEKTALLCACRYPQFLWLATGGCGNLQKEKLQSLMSRRLVVFPDSGEYAKWKSQMEASGHKDFFIMDFLEKYPANTDIADIILENVKEYIPF